MTTCAIASRERAEPLAATAATALTWLLLEQPGPWGVDALHASHLDAATASALAAAVEGTGVRIALIRRPGRHADLPGSHGRHVYAAHTGPGASWVRAWRTDDPAELTGVDFAALGRGEHRGLGAAYRGDPLALVCTNGRRDRCCALLGRPLAAELAATGDANVWEVTHIGGHRFSPTLLVLPHGYAYGRVDASAVKDVLAAVRRGRVVTARCRGRSTWGRAGQAADLAVRGLTREEGADALSVVEESVDATGHWVATVRHLDGRSWRVEGVTASGPPVVASCGAAPGPQPRSEVTAITSLS